MALIKSVPGLCCCQHGLDKASAAQAAPHRCVQLLNCVWLHLMHSLPLNPLCLTNKSVLELDGKRELQNQLTCQLCSCWRIKLPAPHTHEKK